MATEEYKARKRAYITKFKREKCTTVSLKFHNEKDKDIVDFLATVPNKNKWFKELIRRAAKS